MSDEIDGMPDVDPADREAWALPESNQQFPTCEAAGHCPRPTAEAAPFHHFYWDGDRDSVRMGEIHECGRGHEDPLSEYGAVVCKSCARRALILQDSEDFPEI